MDPVQEIHAYLSAEIKLMNHVIMDSLSADEELIRLIGNHISSSGGKRMRPILTLLTSKMYGYNDKQAIHLAAAVEFIHMATILHDDVVDNSTMRRFLKTANVIWGNSASILVGDFLFSQSFKLIVSTKSLSALEVLSDAAAIISEGEVSQLVNLESKKIISQERYLKIINAKTAELFGAACSVGAIISGYDNNAAYLRNFGLELGKMFQITDDMLDYSSSNSVMGKNIGEDFDQGKITLPIILLFKKIPTNQKKELKTKIFSDEKSELDFEFTKNLMIDYDIQSDIDKYLEPLKNNAEMILSSLDVHNQECKKYLSQLVSFAINRSY